MNTPAAAPCNKTQCKDLKKDNEQLKKEMEEAKKENEELKKRIQDLETALVAAQQPPAAPMPTATPVAQPAPPTVRRGPVRRFSPVNYRESDDESGPETRKARRTEKKDKAVKARRFIQKRK